MPAFFQIALLLTGIWFALVVVRFRRSTIVLIAGLGVLGAYTLAAFALDKVRPEELGLGWPSSWLFTLGAALAGLALMLAYSPIADWLAQRWFPKPPTLEAFQGLQQSWVKLILGIAAAWVLGGILEELVVRGIVLNGLTAWLAGWLPGPLALGAAVVIAALGAGIMHSYQGPRAVLIIAQLSLLFGILFVIGGYNLWAVMICHGLYDTIAFVRFARKKSRYSNLGRS